MERRSRNTITIIIITIIIRAQMTERSITETVYADLADLLSRTVKADFILYIGMAVLKC